ncbi:MAG TPA: sigma 54-interacting transcriptional regulator [Polyangia bacterium]|nr:sigma 54-interacting transcriptional regulator [Polyangia bacterium]
MSADAFFSQPLPPHGTVTLGRSSKCEIRVDDPLASREHARLRIELCDEGSILSVTDAGSINGTRLRDTRIEPGDWQPIRVGETVTIGSTMVMVLQDRPPMGPRRLWSHASFEDRLEEECQRAATSGVPFALARLRFSGAALWTTILPILARNLPLPHVFAGYGPHDYELLLLETNVRDAEQLVEELLAVCRKVGIQGRAALAWYPRDGRSVDALLARANSLLRAPAGQDAGSAGGVAGAGGSLAVAGMQSVKGMAARAASSAINVMILGETGVGKEVLARLIHRMSPRAGKPFVALNCAGLSQSLIESELFGHERGAFTGAVGAKIGLLESANGGTVFLDEIGEMPVPMQAKLLRVIEAREVLPVGGVRSRAINVRFLSATNRNLEVAIERGDFRRDLHFRLNVMTLSVPPLRERIDEIPALVDTFLAEICQESGRATVEVSPDAMACLLAYTWPGNIRELKNMLERAFVLCDGAVIGTQHLPLDKMKRAADDPIATAPPVSPVITPVPAAPAPLPPLHDPRKAAERQRILDALAECASNQTRAAELLGMPRRTFVYKLDYYGIPRPQKGRPPEKNG